MEGVCRKLGFMQALMLVQMIFLRHHIDLDILDDRNTNAWRFIGFYGSPEEMYRSESWDLVQQLGSHMSERWLAVEDFNKIAYFFEKGIGSLRTVGVLLGIIFESE
ncbi:hypothetical protein GOBAR_AA28710 [Gossypium barbadense]|uniref:Uncharacterized protein n=1 Tax=Gossypium barbadense TaxID=3634 RepID=A0A2P5WLL3_GOSBA|nr:hypothetical protein GOBAR_AA28710 [Gossypium barbadense]